MIRQVGSHRRYRLTGTGEDAQEHIAHTTVPQHPGDLPPGTLRSIERDLEPVLGKGWLR